MTHLSMSGSYVRKSASVHARALQVAGSQLSDIDETLWELLETPQTIESLRRATSDRATINREQIERSMKRMLDADLIELSPDS